MRSPAARVTAVVAAIEGLALLGYAAGIALVVAISGIQGPEEVASPTGVVVEIVTFAVFGAGMGAISWGRWSGAGWATIPFLVTQLLALTVGIPMATGAADARLWGAGITILAVAGIAALFLGGRDPAVDLRADAPASASAERMQRHRP